MHKNPFDLSDEELQAIKDEQLKDFELIKWYADKNCPICHGTAYQGFNLNELRFSPCPCLQHNIRKALEEKNIPEAEKEGILNKFITMFRLN